MELRPYDLDGPGEAEALWDCKRAFERELGASGGEEKVETYEGKLTEAYRERYLDWVRRCVADDPRCVTVAALPPGACGGATALAGYVFVLPERLSMVWDAAVLNEIYVHPDNRGTGLADQLMDAAVALARDQDLPLDRLVLDVDRENERASAFYERHGFEHWGEMVAREL
ncbi:GNAT family N-acetyltransferase [Halobacteriales archaeon QS_1_68_20]|nr:MAG: GNAT family N-acetyltransferase [Halobacteriales archaeon QS_1_68_20]